MLSRLNDSFLKTAHYFQSLTISFLSEVIFSKVTFAIYSTQLKLLAGIFYIFREKIFSKTFAKKRRNFAKL
jgi:hypothetical protein